ncbi:MAG: hypothetical protein WC865_18685, partial [Bacteroidales bacterium]
MRESRSYGSVGERGGNEPLYPEVNFSINQINVMSYNLKSKRLILLALLVIAGMSIAEVVTSKTKPNLSQVFAAVMGAEVYVATDGRDGNPGTNGNGAWTQKNSGQSKALTVLHYLGNRASRMEAVLPPFPDNLSAWEKRRKQVQRELTSLLGLPMREPMRAKVLASRTEDGVMVEDVSYLLAERC